MQKQTLIYNYLCSLLDLSVNPRLPVKGGYALQVMPSPGGNSFLNKEYDESLSYLLLGKSKDQQALADSLYKVCNSIRNQSDSTLGIYNIETNSPSLVDIEGEFYIWQCQITVKFIN